ncbi:MAG: hypothetical protein OHK0017_13570 [Patescibacteria group bacterium]
MSYELNTNVNSKDKIQNLKDSLINFSHYLKGEKWKLVIVSVAILFNAASTVLTPWIIGLALDEYIAKSNLDGLWTIVNWMIVLYAITVLAGYLQAKVMGRLSQRTLFRLRNHLFDHIQTLPIAFFNQNKSGDLISRLNNDTDKINQFLAESLLRSISSFFSMFGTGIFILFINWQMALLTMAAAVVVIFITRLISPWVENLNKKSLQTTGQFSAEVQENLTNFKAIVAFNRQDYLKQKLTETAELNFKRSTWSEFANGLFNPLYNFAGNIAQIIVLGVGIYFISQGSLTVGLLVAFIGYAQKFYEPMRILGTVWGTFQSALAAWARVQEVLSLKSNLEIINQD